MNGTEMDDHLRERRRLDARAYQPVPYAVEGEPQGLERQRGPDPPTRGSYALHDVFPRSACHARSAQSTVRAHIHSGATRVSVCGLFGPFLSTPQSAKAYPGTAHRRAEVPEASEKLTETDRKAHKRTLAWQIGRAHV